VQAVKKRPFLRYTIVGGGIAFRHSLDKVNKYDKSHYNNKKKYLAPYRGLLVEKQSQNGVIIY
jgi:hypothetical protein